MRYTVASLLVAFATLVPFAAKTQDTWTLMTAREFHEMPDGLEKIKMLRDLEQRDWYYQKMYLDLKGNPSETPKIDLSPTVNDAGETVFLVTDVAPGFPGGKDALSDYLLNQLSDLLVKGDESVQNTIYLEFCIEKDGRVSEVTPSGTPAEWIPAKVIQRCKNALADMPDWSPGIFKNKPVKVKMLMSFSLRE